jgi:hypothetical protein
MQYRFQSRDASSVPLEHPDRGTDEAAVCSGKCTVLECAHVENE